MTLRILFLSVYLEEGRRGHDVEWRRRRIRALSMLCVVSVSSQGRYLPGITNACARDIRPMIASTLDMKDILLEAGGIV